MVTTSLEIYEKTAVEYGLNVTKLRKLQEKVQKNRLVKPLFDTAKWIKDFDLLLQAMANDSISGGMKDKTQALVAQ